MSVCSRFPVKLLRCCAKGSLSSSNHRLSKLFPVVSCRRQSSGNANTRKVTMVPGDGVGLELMSSVKQVFKAVDIPVQFEEFWVSELQDRANDDLVSSLVKSITENRVALLGDISSRLTASDGELASTKFLLRRQLDLYANIVRIQSFKGYKTRHAGLDFVIIREQTEGEYSALEHESVEGVVECIKIITREKSKRIARFAFDYAAQHGRKKVTAVHKANIMKLGDGMFLQSCRDVSKYYPSIQFEPMIVDNTCMQLVSNPNQFDVLVMPNLYGNIIDNLAAGLVGGAGVVPGESWSPNCVVFESGARHPFAQAVGRNIANPTAMLLSSARMLEYMGLYDYGKLLSDAIHDVINGGKARTHDLGGYSTTSDVTAAVISSMRTLSQ